MKHFTDKQDRAWNVEVDGETITRVEGLCGILLTDLIGGPAGDAIAANPVKLLHVLYGVCKLEADKREIGEKAFYALIDGDALDAATEALMAEVLRFFPKRRRPSLQKILDRGRELEELAARKLIEEIDRTPAEKMLAAVLAAKLPANPPGASSGNSPESSGSTPEGSLSDD